MNPLDRMALIAETKEVIVNTYGVDGNAFSIICACQFAMKRAGVQKQTIDAFLKDATSGDYQNVLRTCDSWTTLVHIQPVENHGMIIGALREAGLDPEIQS